MQFLKILLWVVIAVLLTVLAGHNWHDVTVNLWGDIQADIKLPVLLAIFFLLGFLPIFRSKSSNYGSRIPFKLGWSGEGRIG